MTDLANVKSNSEPLPNLFNVRNSISNELLPLPSSDIYNSFHKAETLSTNDFSLVSSYLGNSITSFSLFSPFENFSEASMNKINNKSTIGQNTSPSLETIKTGNAVMKLGDTGTSVSILKAKLNNLGYKVNKTSIFDVTTETALKKFQKDHNVQQTGQLGKTTLDALTRAEIKPQSSTKGKFLAKVSEKIAKARGTVGWCFAGVADSLDRVYGGIVYGKSAYMAAPQLASNSKFKEIKVHSSELPKLPAGSVVVWGKTPASPNGHISVALGDGREASDHVSRQLTNLRGYNNFRVFLPT